ncbi:MAG TPA: DUF4430 domain-containing protein [Candidatus Paceibacterota bacterium]|nr:DUF4430 domain-containing protein [Candidatus Paceibacterota bacterium]
MKKALFALAFTLTPLSVFADNATSTPPAPAQITVTVNVRYQNSIVWSGPVTLTQGSTESLSDDTGSAHSLPTDSALAALAAADAQSPAFSISDLAYYGSMSAFYLKCMSLPGIAASACDDWQYVVDGSYPPVGADHYTLTNGDTIYFYYGDPRRISLSSDSTTSGQPITVHAESYDYTNDSWTPLSGATVGATQPNPNDPYSPLVISTVTTDSNGVATLSLDTIGSYGIGLAMDYYGSTKALKINAPPEASKSPVGTSGSSGESASTGADTIITPVELKIPAAAGSKPLASSLFSTTSEIAVFVPPAPPQIASSTKSADDPVSMDVPKDNFMARYNVASAIIAAGGAATKIEEVFKILGI